MPELRQLRTFLAVAEELSFTRAAQRLYLGQQAVSKSVAALERELGVLLVERSSHHVRLTAAGEALLKAGPAVLADADAAFTRAREAGGGLPDRVTVGVTPAIGPADRDDAVRALRAATTGTISVIDVRPSAIASLLRTRTLDMVIARTWVEAGGVDSATLRPTPAALFVPEGHPLAGAEPVSLSQLDGRRVLTWNPTGTPYTDLLLTRLEVSGATVEPVRARVTGPTVLDDLARADAVALLPSDWPTTDGISRVALADDLLLPLLVLWPAGTSPLAVQHLRAGMTAAA